MKRYLLFLVVLMLWGSTSALALPTLPEGPLYIKFDGFEQISPAGSILAPSGNLESSWGIFNVSSMALGDLSTGPQDFQSVASAFWNAGDDGGFITGIFYGTQITAGPALNSGNGTIEFYYTTTAPDTSVTAVPGLRTWDNAYPGYTGGTLLGVADFVNGAVLPGRPDVSVTGTITPTEFGSSFSGLAYSYANIVDVDGDGVITTADGAWAPYLATQYFTTALGANTADLKLRNIYESNGNHFWNGSPQSNIFGAQMSDPLRAYNVVPEPGTMLLLGAGFLGLAAFGRKRS